MKEVSVNFFLDSLLYVLQLGKKSGEVYEGLFELYDLQIALKAPLKLKKKN